MYVLPTENYNFREEFPPEAAGQQKGRICHEGFPPEGAHRLKANMYRDKFPPRKASANLKARLFHISTQIPMYIILLIVLPMILP